MKLVLLLAAFWLFSDVSASVLIVADTVIAVRSDDKIPVQKPAGLPAELFSAKKAQSKMIAVGGALSAGYRNGGLYREAQLTSFPKLFANQLGIPFRQPLFSRDSAHGTGYKLLRSQQPLADFSYVTNNLGLGKSGWNDLQKFHGKIDSFTFPGLNREMGVLKYIDPDAARHLNRLSLAGPEENSVLDWLKNQISGDFFLFEIGFDDAVSAVKKGQSSSLGTIFHDRFDSSAEIILIEEFYKRKMKGVLFTVPDVRFLPYFSQVTPERLLEGGVRITVFSTTSENPVPFNPERDLIIPSVKIENALSGTGAKHLVLSDSEVLSADPYDDEWKGVDPALFNTYVIKRKASQLKYPVVDLNQLYRDILRGDFVTNDGVRVDPSWPGGNFFSSDGIYPTAFGQAVITNELIRVVNKHYKTSIPLLETGGFLKLK